MDIRIEEVGIGNISCVWIDKSDDCGSIINVVKKSCKQDRKARSLCFDVKEDGESSTIVIKWDEARQCYVYQTDWYDGHEHEEIPLEMFANGSMLILRGEPAHERVYFEITLAK